MTSTPIATHGTWDIHTFPGGGYQAFNRENYAMHTGEFSTLAKLIAYLRETS